MKTAIKVVVLVALLAGAAWVAVWSYKVAPRGEADRPAEPGIATRTRPALRADQLQLIQDLKKEGFLEVSGFRVMVDSELWHRMDAHQREDFAATMAIYCEGNRQDGLYSVKIYSQRSGKLLAEWDSYDGLVVR
ncbi:MAG TPA: hypothetical protein VG167_01000 [Verrucomicrobiae bacterium]|nr:hypothetical protein [Verrucomicrobiae bacterium]